MKVCYFGDYDPNYARNRVLLKGLKENNVGVSKCQTGLKNKSARLDLINKFKYNNNDFDCVLVGYSDSRWVVPLAKRLTKKPIVWDAFYSLYDSWIYDKKLRSSISWRAIYYWWLDYKCCKLSDLILVDTEEHRKYFKNTFFVSDKKIKASPVGTDEAVFYPRAVKRNDNLFKIFFLGKFIPLQGVSYIVKAAAVLEKYSDIKFQIVGRGQTYQAVRQLAGELKIGNIEFVDPVPYEKIPEYLQATDICLGIFGDTNKTLRVIPNKVYEAVALAKPVITAATPAIKELFTDQEDILLCERANPGDLVEKILELKNNKDLREKIAANGYEVFKTKASSNLIGKKLVNLLTDVSK